MSLFRRSYAGVLYPHQYKNKVPLDNTDRGPGSVGPVLPSRIGWGFSTLLRSMYSPSVASSDCPGATSNSSGGMTVDSVEIGLEGL